MACHDNACSCHHKATNDSKPLKLFSIYPELETITPDDAKKSPLHNLLVDDNPFLWSGYRKIPVNDLFRSFQSMFTLHNETINIWNHGIPSFFYIVLAFYLDRVLSYYYPSITLIDKFAFLFYCFCAILTFGFSAMYHTWRMNSETAYHFCLLCDIRGIVLLVCGANNLTIILLFKHFENIRNIYLIINIVVVIILLIWIKKMVRERLTNQRTLYFTIYSLLPLVNIAHRILLQSNNLTDFFLDIIYSVIPRTFHSLLPYNENLKLQNSIYNINHDITQIFIMNYLILGFGLVVRAYKAPERWKRFTFDIFGASHQIFHTISVYGSWFIIKGMLDLYHRGVFEVK
ncbi:hypothetical protein ABK040_008027 [Willaertia magna]